MQTVDVIYIPTNGKAQGTGRGQAGASGSDSIWSAIRRKDGDNEPDTSNKNGKAMEKRNGKLKSKRAQAANEI